MNSDLGGPLSLLALLRAARDDEDGFVDLRDAAQRHGVPPELIDDAAGLAGQWGLLARLLLFSPRGRVSAGRRSR